MPCYRCGERQSDPARGESSWRRAVQAGRHVLVCPGCQAIADWTADLDRCPACASVHLVRRLGESECRDCGVVGEPGGAQLPGRDDVPPGLAEEVERALARVLGRAGRPAGIG